MKQNPRDKRRNGGNGRSNGNHASRASDTQHRAADQDRSESQRKSNRRLVAGIFTSAIVVAILIAFGVYAVISNSPENLLRLAMFNAVKDKAAAANVELSGGDGKPPIAGNVAFAVDQTNNDNWRATFDTSTNNAQLNAEALVLNQEIYFKGNGTNPEQILTDNGWVTLDTENLRGKLNGQWYKVNAEDVRALADIFSWPIAVPSSSDIGRIAEIYTQHQFIHPDRIFDDEVIDGVNTAHFSLKRNNDEFVAFLQAVQAANLKTVKITEKEISWARESGSEALLPGSTVEVWIGRDNKKLKQMRATTVANSKESVATATFENNPPNLGGFNAPQESKPITELIMSFLGPALSPAGYNSRSSDIYTRTE